MSESYASKRERWQKLLAALPESLRGHVSLRNVEAVSALAPQAQATLAQAIQAGLKRMPRAIEIFGKFPDIAVSDLLEKISAAHAGSSRENGILVVDNLVARKQLADLIQFCYPDMPRLSAEALSAADALAGVLQVVSTHEALFNSPHLHSDFVLVLFHACLAQAAARLDAKLAENPAFQKAVSQSGLNHQPREVTNA